jgi:hypothetical protein
MNNARLCDEQKGGILQVTLVEDLEMKKRRF